ENENETESKSRQRKPSISKVEFVKSSKHVKSPTESVKKVENSKNANYPRKNSQSPRENGGKTYVEQCKKGESPKFSKNDSPSSKKKFCSKSSLNEIWP
ncbi:hypothetical protein Tco_0431068, partial [Tanacetum coccineum]